MSNDRLDVAPAPIGPCVQVCPPLVAEHDQDDEPTRPSRVMPEGSVIVAVTGPVAAVPGSDTLTVTSAVTPRLSTPDTWTDTLSFAVAETVGLGVGDVGGDLLGLPVGELEGEGLPDRDGEFVGLGEAPVEELGVAERVGVVDGDPPMAFREAGAWPPVPEPPWRCVWPRPGTAWCPDGGWRKYRLGTAMAVTAAAVPAEAIG